MVILLLHDLRSVGHSCRLMPHLCSSFYAERGISDMIFDIHCPCSGEQRDSVSKECEGSDLTLTLTAKAKISHRVH